MPPVKVPNSVPPIKDATHIVQQIRGAHQCGAVALKGRCGHNPGHLGSDAQVRHWAIMGTTVVWQMIPVDGMGRGGVTIYYQQHSFAISYW